MFITSMLPVTLVRRLHSLATAIAMISFLVAVQALPAFASIDNTVIVTGSSPGNANDVVASATLSVGVVEAAPQLAVRILADQDANVPVGQTVNLTYIIENAGNVTLTGVRLGVSQEGAGTLQRAAPAEAALSDRGTEGDSADDGTDDAWDRLAPGDAITFTARYTVVQADLEGNGGGDGALEARASAVGTFNDLEATGSASLAIDLEDIVTTLAVAKTADRTENVAAGDVITYTYTVTNTGNVTITAISLSESHNGSGPVPVPGGETLTTDGGTEGDSSDREADGIWDVLGPQDVVTFTATYTVTQSDIETLQ